MSPALQSPSNLSRPRPVGLLDVEAVEKGIDVLVPAAGEPQMRPTKVTLVIFVLPVIFFSFTRSLDCSRQPCWETAWVVTLHSRAMSAVGRPPMILSLINWERCVRPSQAHRVNLFQNKFASLLARRWIEACLFRSFLFPGQVITGAERLPNALKPAREKKQPFPRRGRRA
jgi:hypothetical protein